MSLGDLNGYDFFFFWVFGLSVLFHFAGYIYVLALIRALRFRKLPPARVASDGECPRLHVIVCTLNEEAMIGRKLDNLAEQDYPRERLRVLVVDGGSSDGTRLRFDEFAARHPSLDLTWMDSPRRGKIPQLNLALATVAPADWVVVTDADTLIGPRDALRKVAGYAHDIPGIGAVGGWSSPPAAGLCFDADPAYWDKQNRLRHMETHCFSSSIVVAPFYAFPRVLIASFPEDCVADDVFASMAAHLQSRRLIYSAQIPVIETRQAGTVSELFRHKFRKAHAYTIELLRVLHQLPWMGRRVKFFFAVKILQVFYLPWALLGLLLWSGRLILGGWAPGVAVFYACFLLAIVGASLMMVPPPGRTRGGFRLKPILSSALVFAVTLAVLVLNFFLFPFTVQGSSYERLRPSND